MHPAFQVCCNMNCRSSRLNTYVPFLDLRNVDKMTFNFELGTPFKPYEQLMGVLPVASMDHIPLAYRASFW